MWEQNIIYTYTDKHVHPLPIRIVTKFQRFPHRTVAVLKVEWYTSQNQLTAMYHF